MDRQGVEQFVGEDDSLNTGRGRFIPGLEPVHFAGKWTQPFLLPLPAARRRFQNPVLQYVQQIGPARFEPVKNVFGQPAVVRAGFEELELFKAAFFHPPGELKGEQFAEQAADTRARIEIAAFAGRVH